MIKPSGSTLHEQNNTTSAALTALPGPSMQLPVRKKTALEVDHYQAGTLLRATIRGYQGSAAGAPLVSQAHTCQTHCHVHMQGGVMTSATIDASCSTNYPHLPQTHHSDTPTMSHDAGSHCCEPEVVGRHPASMCTKTQLITCCVCCHSC